MPDFIRCLCILVDLGLRALFSRCFVGASMGGDQNRHAKKVRKSAKSAKSAIFSENSKIELKFVNSTKFHEIHQKSPNFTEFH